MPWQIDQDLWVGGSPSAKQLQKIKPVAIITVRPKPLEDEFIAMVENRYVHHPLSDGQKLQLERYRAAYRDAMAWWRAATADWPLLVHCNAGQNRSPLLATLMIRTRYGFTGTEAIAYVDERRPNALTNEVFREWLSLLEAP